MHFCKIYFFILLKSVKRLFGEDSILNPEICLKISPTVRGAIKLKFSFVTVCEITSTSFLASTVIYSIIMLLFCANNDIDKTTNNIINLFLNKIINLHINTLL